MDVITPHAPEPDEPAPIEVCKACGTHMHIDWSLGASRCPNGH